MSTDGVEITSGEQVRLLDELQSLLARQLQLVRQGDSVNKQFGVLTGKAGSLVGEIARTGILELAEVKNRREQLRKLYQNLCLALAAQQAETAEKLSRVRRAKKTIEVYRNNVRFR